MLPIDPMVALRVAQDSMAQRQRESSPERLAATTRLVARTDPGPPGRAPTTAIPAWAKGRQAMRRNRLRALVAGLAMGALLLGTVPSVTAHRGDGGGPSRPADTDVAAWDAIGTQASGAAALPPAAGHTTVAYVGIAVDDSGHRVLVRYLPTPWCLAPDRGDSSGRCGHR